MTKKFLLIYIIIISIISFSNVNADWNFDCGSFDYISKKCSINSNENLYFSSPYSSDYAAYYKNIYPPTDRNTSKYHRNGSLGNNEYPEFPGWHLNGTSCDIVQINNHDDYKIEIKSNLGDIYYFSSSNININHPSPEFKDYMKKYYYMKTFVFAKAQIDSNNFYYTPDYFEGKYTYNNMTYNTGLGTTWYQLREIWDIIWGNTIYPGSNIPNFDNSKFPYVLLKPDSNSFTFDEMKEELKNKCIDNPSLCGDYNITYYAIPIDGKCDFDNDGILNISDFTFRSTDNNAYILQPIFEGSKKRTDGNIEFDDKISKHKISFDPIRRISYYVGYNNEPEIISLPGNQHNSIKIYKNNVLNRSDEIVPEMIALVSHKINNFKNVSDAQNFINSSYNLMNSLNISKYLDNSTTGKTIIKINLNLGTSQLKNLTLYQVIPKPYTYDNITFLSDGGAQRLVLDKDPVIGWYFDESSGDEFIEYSLPGTTEGGVIIVTQEPILFNEGNLVINYRENSCEVGEVSLFELDSLEDSKVYSSGSHKLYSVCIAHLTESLSNTKNNLYQHIFNFTSGGNVSLNNLLGFDNSIYISIVNTTPIYWDLKIQKENPTGDYSCLGSVNDLNNSLFGDCGYNSNNRIWLHLGDDTIAPTTTLSFPYLTHSAQITLQAEDNIGGSGLKDIKYCVDNSGSCSPTLIYSNPFSLTCVNDWGCDKYIRFSSEDLDGNIESIQTKKIKLLDKGNSCNDDCTAKPSPNRYLAECRNLGECRYFETAGDEGLFVAEKCDFMTPNSWVKYNSTHEIKCPMGPLRKSQFTNSILSIFDSLCDNIIKTPYPVILNGEQIIMNVLTCINPY